MIACAKKNIRIANYILTHFPQNINPRLVSVTGICLFHFCLNVGPEHEEFILRVIETYNHNLTPQQICSENGHTPLTLSIERTTERISLRILEMFGENTMPKHKDNKGKSALDYAKERGFDFVIKILEEMESNRTVGQIVD